MSRRPSNKSKRTLLALALVAVVTALWPITRYKIADSSELFDLPQLATRASENSTVYLARSLKDPRVSCHIEVHFFRWAWQADQPLAPHKIASHHTHQGRATWKNLAFDVAASGPEPGIAKAFVEELLEALVTNAKAKKGLDLRFDTNGNSIWERHLKSHYREMQKKLRP